MLWFVPDTTCAASFTQNRCLQGDQQQTPTQQIARTHGTADRDEQPHTKRRKHFGVRYGAPAATRQQALPAKTPEPRQQQQKQPINHHQAQRAKAEAQLHGRKFHLDTSSCAPPDQGQLFTSQAWSLPDMLTEKKRLNDTKNLLDCKDIKYALAENSMPNCLTYGHAKQLL